MAEQEQQRQDVVREPIVRDGVTQAASASGTAGKQNVVREPIVRQQNTTQTVPNVNPETSPQRFNPIPSSVPIIGRPDSIPHAPALETATHLAGEGGKALTGLVGGAYGLGKDLLFSEGAKPNGETAYGPGGLLGMTTEGFHPLDRAGHLLDKYVAKPFVAEQKKSQAALAGDPNHPVMNQLESFGHGLASVLPLIGPYASSMGEQAGTGDIEGTAANVGTTLLAPKVAEGAIGAAGKVVKGGVKMGRGLYKMGDLADQITANNKTRVGTPEEVARLKAGAGVPRSVTKPPIIPPDVEPPVSQGTPAPKGPKGPKPGGPITMSSPEIETPEARPIGGVSPEAQFQNSFGPEEKLVKGQAEWDLGNKHGNFPPPPSETLPEQAPFSVPPDVMPSTRPQTPMQGILSELGKQTGVKELEPNVPLKDQVGKPGVEPKAHRNPIEAANGPRVWEHLKDDPKLAKEFHDLKNNDLAQALMNSGEDIGQARIGDKKTMGEGQIKRQDAIHRLMDKGLSPREIIDLAKKQSTPDWAGAPKPAGKS